MLAEIYGIRSIKKSYRPSEGGYNVEDQAPRAVLEYSHDALLLLCLHPVRAMHLMGPAPLGNIPSLRSDGGYRDSRREAGTVSSPAPDNAVWICLHMKLFNINCSCAGETGRFGTRNPSLRCAQKHGLAL